MNTIRTHIACLGFVACTHALALPSPAAQRPSDIALLGQRDAILVQLERLPQGQLETAFLRCARESSERLLAPGEAALCSAAGEVLKQRRFGGDFEALLAWWRTQRERPVDPSPAAAAGDDEFPQP